MSELHFIGGEKGGVGKSVVSRLLAQYFIDNNQPLTVFDSDLSHGAMMRYYRDCSTAIDLAKFEDLDRVVEAAAEGQNSKVIIDLAAQTIRPLYRWIDDNDFLELAAETGISASFWHVMDGGKDSVNLLSDLVDAFPGREHGLIVVRNFGRSHDFSTLTESPVNVRLQADGIPVIDLPELHEGAMTKIDRIDASFWAAANNRNREAGPCLNLMERQRVKIWTRRFYAQLDGLGVIRQTQHNVADNENA